MKKIIYFILIGIFTAGLIVTSCESDNILVDSGTFPETGGIDLSMGMLRSINYAKNNPLIDMDHKTMEDALRIELTQPATETETFTVSINEAEATNYNAKQGVNYPLFPAELIILSNEGKMAIEKGKQESNTISVSFKHNESLKSAVYILPLTVETNTDADVSEKQRTLYYRINVWGEVPAEYNAIEKNYIQIAGIDPELTNPLLINKLYIAYPYANVDPIPYFNPFDIVNLQSATVKVDENNLPYLYLKEDLAFVLSKRLKYIAPLQKQNHKVCLAIKGSGEGIGFSNLTPFQQETFAYRIKKMVDQYELDGVNLHDEGFGIQESKTDLTKGLCEFVSLLRKELGDKIITYTQTKESPAGITNDKLELKLGELVDYAWTDQLNTIVNPWDHPEQWWSKPIAGITKEKWGALNSDIRITRSFIDALDMALIDGTMLSEEINHVFVINSVEDTKIGVEGGAVLYMIWGAEANLYDIYNDISRIMPNQYLNPYYSLIPKDY